MPFLHFKVRYRWVVLCYKGQYFFLHSCIILESFLSVREFYVATKTSRIPHYLNFLGETAFFGGIFCLEYPSRRGEKVNFYFTNYRSSFCKLQIFISQTTDSHFANYRFSFHKLQIFTSQTTDFHFVLFHLVSFHFVSLHFVSQTTVSHFFHYHLLNSSIHFLL